jgi:hypothetical protein
MLTELGLDELVRSWRIRVDLPSTNEQPCRSAGRYSH